MPIYAYKCESCGFAKDVLQKVSDAPLQECPSCHQPSFKKQLTAAGFQLKGSGWYVTDFRGGNAPATGAAAGTSAGGDSAAPAQTATSEPAAKSETSATPAAPTTPSTPSSSSSSSSGS